jgi:amino acid adenylation domain-containing protein
LNAKIKYDWEFRPTVGQLHMLELCLADDAACRAYSDVLAVELSGDLDRSVMRRAIDALVARHESLRTVFTAAPARAVVQPDGRGDAKYIDLCKGAEAVEAAVIDAWIREETAHTFDLQRGPLVRFRIARAGERRHLLLLHTHHIVCDGWSQAALLKELARDYSRIYTGAAPAAEPPAPTFSAYAAALTADLSSADFAQKKAYWLDQLATGPEPLELPVDGAAEAGGFRGASVFRKIDAALAAQFDQFARSQRCTPNMFLYACYTAFLQRLTGSRRFAVPVSTAGRHRPEYAQLVGHCTSILPVVNEVRPEATFTEHLADAKSRLLEAYKHQEMPFADLLEAAVADGNRVADGLLKATFNYNVDNPVPAFAGLEASYRLTERAQATADLLFNFTRLADGLLLECNFRARQFSSALAEELVGAFIAFCANLVANPALPMREVDCLSAADRASLRAQLASPARPPAVRETVKQMLEAAAVRAGDARALTDGARSWSYAEFNNRANQLAWRLAELAGPVRRVGICMPRSAEMLFSIAAALKAGVTYVPMDPSHPEERLAYITEVAGLDMILTTGAVADKLRNIPCALMDLTDEGELALQVGCRSDNPPDRALEEVADHIAYVIFTSGSTGRPKGVMVTQGNLSNYIGFAREVLVPDHLDAVLVAQPLVFDASVNAIIPTLCRGIPLVIVPEDNSLLEILPVYLMDAGRHYMFTLTPSHLSALRQLEEIQPNPESRHHFIVGGEPLSSELMATWADQLLPRATFVNQYGPTEATVGVTHHWIRHDPVAPANRKGTVSIGVPNDNVSLFVLDACGHPVPYGMVGELYIGGPTVSAGYINNEEQNRDRFLALPHLIEGRVYRTGDRVRATRDGTLHFIERIDNQVKLRGYRIELDEIQSVVLGHPAVGNAAVCLVGGGDNRQIAAFLVARDAGGDARDLCEQVRRHAAAHLPPYMVPSTIARVADIPLTTNGKVDTRALAAGLQIRPADAPAGVLSDTFEKGLAEIWSANLGKTITDPAADYFLEGGNSLLAIRLVNAINRRFGCRLRTDEVYLDTSLKGMAARIRRQQGDIRAEIRIPQRADGAPGLLSFAQQRLWFLAQMEEDISSFNMTAAYRIDGPLDVVLLEQCFAALVERHQILRTRYHLVDGEPRQIVGDNNFHIEIVPAASDVPSQVQELARIEGERPFDLESDLMLRVKLIEAGGECRYLLITLHHIAADGWSVGILVDELARLYGARAGKSIGDGNLPPLPIQYADFAAWQRAHYSAIAGECLAFWTSNLQGIPACHSLPLDRPRTFGRSARGTRLPTRLPAAATEALRQLARDQGLTLFMVLRTLFSLLLHRHSQDRAADIVFGTPAAGRPSQECEGLIGLFVNSLVLRNRVSGGSSLRGLFAETRARSLAEAQHSHMPFDQLVEALNPERDGRYSPLVQILLSLQNNEVGEFTADGLTISRLECAYQVSKYELMLDAEERGDELLLTWEYATELFEDSTVAALAEDFLHLLELAPSVVDRPVDWILHALDERGAPDPAATPLHTIPAVRPPSPDAPKRTETMSNPSVLNDSAALAERLKAEIMDTGLIARCYVKPADGLVSDKAFLAILVPPRNSPLTDAKIIANIGILVASVLPKISPQVEYVVMREEGAEPRPAPAPAAIPAADDDIEQGLRQIWRELLERDDFTTQDSFFTLGGHSLLVVKLRLKIAERYHSKISIQKLFELQTLADQAAWIRETARIARAQSSTEETSELNEEFEI